MRTTTRTTKEWRDRARQVIADLTVDDVAKLLDDADDLSDALSSKTTQLDVASKSAEVNQDLIARLAFVVAAAIDHIAAEPLLGAGNDAREAQRDELLSDLRHVLNEVT